MNEPIEPLDKKHVMNFVTGAYLTGDYIMPKRVKSAIEGLKNDIKKWDKEKIQGLSEKEQAWTYEGIEFFINKWFPLFYGDVFYDRYK